MDRDFCKMISDLLPRITNQKVLRRVWRILEYAYIDQLDMPRSKSERKTKTA